MSQTIKSKQRMTNFSEVLTPVPIVNALLDLVKQEPERIAPPRLLEPACGTDNFLIEIWRRKLQMVQKRYARRQMELGLFKRVTGLTVQDFELLVSLGFFNSALMNDAVYKFMRYEDPTLVYLGVNLHEGEDIGLFDTILRQKEYEAPFVNE